MSRLLTRAVRLLKFGAVAGVAVAVGRMVMQRRRKPETGESSWPTIAETAAQNGQPVDEVADDAAGSADDTGDTDSAEDDDGSSTGDTDDD